jgi:phage shock protein E
VALDAVVSDSRCPKNVQCITAGDATIRVKVRRASAESTHELHTAEGAAQEAADGGLTIRLLRLDPYPVEGKPIAPREYVATLQVTRASSNPAGPQP